MYYILRGRDTIPCDMWTWTAALERRDGNRIIGFWKFKSCDVSTVFLGLDHSYGSGPPILFETLVFGGPLEDEGERYSTYDEAEQGHLHYCEMVRLAEKQLNWRKAKRYRNRLEKDQRNLNNRKRQQRMLQRMQELNDKLRKELPNG